MTKDILSRINDTFTKAATKSRVKAVVKKEEERGKKWIEQIV